MSETILREPCPACGKNAYYSIGDIDDQTVEDYDGGICPWCGHQFLFEGVQEIMLLEERDAEDANIVEGEKELREGSRIVLAVPAERVRRGDVSGQ